MWYSSSDLVQMQWFDKLLLNNMNKNLVQVVAEQAAIDENDARNFVLWWQQEQRKVPRDIASENFLCKRKMCFFLFTFFFFFRKFAR